MLKRTVFCLALIVAVGFSTCHAADETINENNAESDQQTREKLQQIKQQIKQVQQRLTKQRKQYGSATQQLRKTERRINSAAKILRATSAQLANKQQQLQQNRAEERQLEQDKRTQQQLLAEQLRSAYSSGRQPYLKLLLNQQEPAKLGRVLAYYDYLNKARTTSIEQLGKTLTALIAIQQAIEQQVKDLAILETSQRQEQQRLVKLKQQRKKELTQLASAIQSQDSRLLRLRENEEELESLLREVQTALAELIQPQDLIGLKSVKGSMRWPVSGRLTQSYGERINRDMKSNGIRINGKEGADVRAIHHGQVVYSDWLRGFGLLTILDHGKGYMSLYGNNQSLFKEVGDFVEAGELIATLGQSGGQQTPSLYFEIRHQGRAQNPLSFIRRR